mmetsp:Transcript_93060/g.267742  ORF Transcript_93060/g.267742 Transcript_93060/m.267742 type:complete len:225 (-) Transcript_93060:253-927(-)
MGRANKRASQKCSRRHGWSFFGCISIVVSCPRGCMPNELLLKISSLGQRANGFEHAAFDGLAVRWFPMNQQPCSSKSNQVGRVRSARVLHDVHLRAGQAIDGAVIPVRLVAEGKDALVVRVTEAWHPGHQQAHQHLPGAVGGGLAAEAAVRDVLGVPREVGAGPPQRGASRAAGQRLEASDGAVHDGIDGACVGAVEGICSVDTGLEPQALVLDRSAQRRAVRN